MENQCKYFELNPLEKEYHDTEWGHPHHDDRKMFEHLSMEVMQCGLSWDTCLKRKEILERCFDNFDISKVAEYTDADVQRILNTKGMIRAERKIRAIIGNARIALKIAEEFGSLSDYFWQFTYGKTLIYEGHPDGEIPAQNGLSRRIATDLRKRGMTFVGPVNIYAHLQSCGIVHDHSRLCSIFKEVTENYPVAFLPKDDEI